MPEVVVAAVDFAIGTSAAIDTAIFIAENAAMLQTAALTVGVFGYSAHQRRRMERKAKAAYNASLRDRTITVRGTLEERDLVMGRVRKGGYFYPVGTTGADSETFTFIVVMAGHSISAVNTNYFDEHALELDSDGWVTSAPYVTANKTIGSATITMSAGAGSITLPHSIVAGSVSVVVGLSGESGTDILTPTVVGNVISVSGYGSYSGPATVSYQYLDGKKLARIRWMMGSESQAARADLIADFPSLWTINHRLRGCSYARIDLTYSPDVFPGGIPNFSADMDGADTVEDTRTSTTGYSANNALLARWYALHPLGGRRTTSQLDEASFVAAANVCDTSVDYGDGAQPLYQAGYVAKAGQAPAEVLDELCEAMAGRWGYTQGAIRLRAGAVAAPVATITSDWLLTRQMSFRARRPRGDLRNVLQGTFADQAAAFQTVQFPRVPDTPAIASDGAELPGEVEFQAISHSGQAQQVAACMLRYERQALVVTLQLKMRAWPLQLFDVVAVTLADMGWSGKLFEVLDRSFTLGGGVSVTLKEIDSSIFAFGASFPVNDPAPNSLLPDPRNVPTVGTLTVTSTASVLADGTVRTQVSVAWPAITDAGVTDGGYVEVAWADARTPSSFTTQRADSVSSHQIVGALTSGVHHIFIARCVNGAGVRGDWSTAVAHQVAGKAAVPASVAGLSATAQPGGVLLAWTASTEPDHAETEVRQGASWAAGTTIYNGRAAQIVWAWPGAGTYTVWAKHRDTSGGESTSAASVGITVGTSSLIGTSQVATDAVTKVHTATATGVAVTGEKGVPTGTFTDLVSITFTPPVDCEVLIAVDGSVSIATAASGTLGDFAMFSSRLVVNSSQVGPLRTYAIDLQVGYSKTASATVARAHSFAATGGVAYTVTVQGQQYVVATTCTVESIRLRLEEIRR